MPDRRASRVWALINARAHGDDSPPTLSHACRACAELLGASGVAVAMSNGHGSLEPLACTDASTEEVEELQYTLGQGPVYEADAANRPVLTPDLAAPAAERRWPIFAPAAVAHGVRAIFAFPVAVGAARVGVLSVHRTSPGPLSADDLRYGMICADIVLDIALDDRAAGVPGEAYPGIESSDRTMIELSGPRMDVHQATGMVSAQLDVHITDALARLRAYAYVHDRRLVDVAADVVTRRLRFAPDGANSDGPTQP